MTEPFTVETFRTIREPLDSVLPMNATMRMEREDILNLMSLLTHSGYLVSKFRDTLATKADKKMVNQYQYYAQLHEEIETMVTKIIPDRISDNKPG